MGNFWIEDRNTERALILQGVKVKETETSINIRNLSNEFLLIQQLEALLELAKEYKAKLESN